MKDYIVNPGVSTTFLPGVGRAQSGQRVRGDFDALVPGTLTEVLPTAAQRAQVSAPGPLNEVLPARTGRVSNELLEDPKPPQEDQKAPATRVSGSSGLQSQLKQRKGGR